MIFRICGSHLPGGCRTRLPRRRGKFFGRGPQLVWGEESKPAGREANFLRRACVRRASVLCAFGVGRIPKIDGLNFRTGTSFGADNSVFAVIRTLQHRPRHSNRCVGQTLTCKYQSKHTIDRFNPQPVRLRRRLTSKFSGCQSSFLCSGRFTAVNPSTEATATGSSPSLPPTFHGQERPHTRSLSDFPRARDPGAVRSIVRSEKWG